MADEDGSTTARSSGRHCQQASKGTTVADKESVCSAYAWPGDLDDGLTSAQKQAQDTLSRKPVERSCRRGAGTQMGTSLRTLQTKTSSGHRAAAARTARRAMLYDAPSLHEGIVANRRTSAHTRIAPTEHKNLLTKLIVASPKVEAISDFVRVVGICINNMYSYMVSYMFDVFS